MIACMKMAFPNEVARPAASQVSCAACGLGALCRAETAETAGEGPLRRKLAAGESLFEAGTTQSALYAVHAGFLKTCKRLPAGGQQVVGLHIMGDVLGLDGIASHVHATDAIALTTSDVCVIALAKADRLLEREPTSAARLRSLLSDHVARAGDQLVTLGSLSAQQRVAAFLLDMSDRWASRGYSATIFDLCMTRKDIGSYLGLTFETVSRMLSDFRDSGWVHVDARRIEILDRNAIERVLDGASQR